MRLIIEVTGLEHGEDTSNEVRDQLILSGEDAANEIAAALKHWQAFGTTVQVWIDNDRGAAYHIAAPPFDDFDTQVQSDEQSDEDEDN